MNLFPDAPGTLYIEEEGNHTETKLAAGDYISYKPETGIAVERMIGTERTRLLFRFANQDTHARRWPIEEEETVDLLVLDFAHMNGFDTEQPDDNVLEWRVIAR